MLRLRRRLARLAGLWLVCQLSVHTLVPVTAALATTSTDAIEDCTCAHGDGQVCPMHHRLSHSSSSSSKRTCVWQCANTADDAATLSFLGPIALPSQQVSATPVIVRSGVVSAPFAIPSDLVPIPDAPPPRA